MGVGSGIGDNYEEADKLYNESQTELPEFSRRSLHLILVAEELGFSLFFGYGIPDVVSKKVDECSKDT